MQEKGENMKKESNHIEYEDGTRIQLHEEDVPELTDNFFRNARPMGELFPELAAYSAKRKVGRPKSQSAKRLQSFKLSPDVIEHIKASGPGYNVRVEAVLRSAIENGVI